MFQALLPTLAVLWTLLPQAAVAQPDTARGALIALGGGPGGARNACFTCHGIAGAGQAATGTPALAGLDADYLKRQLDDYASGRRPNEIMSPIAHGLGPAERQAVSRYYAEMPRGPAESAARPDAALLQEGAALYAAGAPPRDVQACLDCHGPKGHGLDPVPAVAGQPAAYTAGQLRLWQEGKRTNDPDGVMARVARKMTVREIAAVAAYLESLTAVSLQSDRSRW